MTRWLARLGLLAVGVLVALAAFGVVHREVLPVESLVVGGLALAAAEAIHRSWSHLPAYVATWLDLGVVVGGVLLAVVGHALSLGLPFAVLRGPELTALFGAAGLLSLVVSGLAYTHLRLATEVEATERRLAELQRAALESRLSALAARINPHFLFNTLNTLAEVVHEDEDAAEDLVTDLSAMMRSALAGSARQIPLADELDTCRRLLRIESARLGARLHWSIDGLEHLEDHPVTVPGLLVQPLVENAVKHGAAARAEGGSVRIVLEPVDGALHLRIADDGPGLPDEVATELESGRWSLRGTEQAGGGLATCAERLRLTWEGRAHLRHEPTETGTTLVLELPLESP